MLIGADATRQRFLEHIKVKRMPFVLPWALTSGSQGQRVTGQQLLFKRRACKGWQLSPGLRREHHQTGQIIGRTPCQRQQDKQHKQCDNQNLNDDEGASQHQGALLRQTSRGPQGDPPFGLKRYPSPRTVRM